MLEMERTTEGSIRVRNRRQSEVVRDATEARRVAHHWGHTSLSIDKALAEMMSEEGTQEARPGWKLRRATPEAAATPPPEAEVKTKPAPRARRARRPTPSPARPEPAEPAHVAAPEPVAEPEPPKRSRRKPAPKAAPARDTAQQPAPLPEPEPAPEPRAAKPTRRRTPRAAAPSAPVAEPDAGPRVRALELARELARELRAIEDAELAFARGPWAELRESAEHVVACLSGRRATRATARGSEAG